MRMAIAGVLMLTFAGPAFANECPGLYQQISQKMNSGSTQLSAADKAKVTQLQKQGEDLHHAGDHAKSAATFKQALALLG